MSVYQSPDERYAAASTHPSALTGLLGRVRTLRLPRRRYGIDVQRLARVDPWNIATVTGLLPASETAVTRSKLRYWRRKAAEDAAKFYMRADARRYGYLTEATVIDLRDTQGA